MVLYLRHICQTMLTTRPAEGQLGIGHLWRSRNFILESTALGRRFPCETPLAFLTQAHHGRTEFKSPLNTAAEKTQPQGSGFL